VKSRLLIGLVFACTVLPLVNCFILPHSVTARVRMGSQYCSVVSMPGEWTPSDTLLTYLPAMYRRVDNSAFLYSLRRQDSYLTDLPVNEKYWISLDHVGTVRKA
jgi:hypothetical protein